MGKQDYKTMPSVSCWFKFDSNSGCCLICLNYVDLCLVYLRLILHLSWICPGLSLNCFWFVLSIVWALEGSRFASWPVVKSLSTILAPMGNPHPILQPLENPIYFSWPVAKPYQIIFQITKKRYGPLIPAQSPSKQRWSF